MGEISLDEIKLNLLIKISEAKVFHVILTGGEFYVKFNILVKALKKSKREQYFSKL